MIYYFAGMVGTILFSYWGWAENVNILFLLGFLIWFYMMIYSYSKIEKRSILFAFGIAFFVFLLGREFVEQYKLMPKDWEFPITIDNHLYICIILALIGVWSSFVLFSPKSHLHIKKQNQRYLIKARRMSKSIFFIVLPFAIVYWTFIAYFVSKTGYHSYYSDFSEVLDGNPLFSLLNKITVMLSVSFCCFLSTLPTKSEFKKLLVPYLLFLFVTAFSGQRGPFILGLLLIFVFVVYMQGLYPSDRWFKKKYLKITFVFAPLLASGGSYYNAIRLEKDFEDVSFFESMGNFFYEQGVTGYVVKRAYEYEERIPKDIYTLQFIHTGILARVLGIDVYAGNTVEHATKGGSFAHALGYVVLGKGYLMGAGTGSSYIAELYYDFGYPGVLFGSVLYGFLFSLLYRTKSLLERATIFVSTTQLLWSCRSSYTGFLTLLFTPTTMLVCFLVFTLNYKKIRIGKRHEQSEVKYKEVEIQD